MAGQNDHDFAPIPHPEESGDAGAPNEVVVEEQAPTSANSEPEAIEHEEVGALTVHHPVPGLASKFITYLVFDDLSVYLPLAVVHFLLNLERDTVKPMDRMKIKKFLKSKTVHTLRPTGKISLQLTSS